MVNRSTLAHPVGAANWDKMILVDVVCKQYRRRRTFPTLNYDIHHIFRPNNNDPRPLLQVAQMCDLDCFLRYSCSVLAVSEPHIGVIDDRNSSNERCGHWQISIILCGMAALRCHLLPVSAYNFHSSVKNKSRIYQCLPKMDNLLGEVDSVATCTARRSTVRWTCATFHYCYTVWIQIPFLSFKVLRVFQVLRTRVVS